MMEIKQIRNPQYNAEGNIDCEIDHPDHGWMPYTIANDDVDNTIDNGELKKMADEIGIEKYVEPEIPKNPEAEDIINSL
tara:strand:- start:8260 stop:8496 length:237 start_codon:yes stop_codon:yes gene_type:complete